MAQTPEAAVKKAVKERLVKYGLRPLGNVNDMQEDLEGFFFMPVAGPFSVHGIHDFVGCWRGVFFSIETKAPNNPEDHTQAQLRFRVAVCRSGGIAFTGVRDASVVDTIAALVEERHA